MVLNQTSSFVCYSLPGNSDFELIQGEINEISSANWPSESGFIISKFNPQDSYLFLIGNSIQKNPNFSFEESSCSESNIMSKDEYVKLCIDYIEKCDNEIEKIILSRVKQSTTVHSASTIFHALREQYPNAFVYLLNSPLTGTWIGATPETFVKRNHNSFTTMALAGTQMKQNNYHWENKEKREQQLVANFINDELTSLGVSATVKGPFTAEAGNIAHLCSNFSFESNLNPVKFIQALHPTPAVCGLPRELTKSIISNSEPHDRELYCGFLGPINFNDMDELYVNLRCLKMNKQELHLMVGGGITSESDPEKEWNETEAKAQTLLNVIEKI